jgi:hypothetical protein
MHGFMIRLLIFASTRESFRSQGARFSLPFADLGQILGARRV